MSIGDLRTQGSQNFPSDPIIPKTSTGQQGPSIDSRLDSPKARDQLNRKPSETQATSVLDMLSKAGSATLRAIKCTGIVLGYAILGFIVGAVFAGGTAGLISGFAPPGVILGAAIGGFVGLVAGIVDGVDVAKAKWQNT